MKEDQNSGRCPLFRLLLVIEWLIITCMKEPFVFEDDFTTSAGLETPKVSLHFPRHIHDLIADEAKLLALSRSGLLRRVLRWHFGAAMGRPEDGPKHFVPEPSEEKSVKLQVRLEEEDLRRLRLLTDRVGLKNSGVLALLFLRWLGLDGLQP